MSKYGISYPLARLPREVCQICGQKHGPAEPHDAESLYYKQYFHKAHGRKPTWEDAIAHCPNDIKETSRLLLGYMHFML